MVLTAYFALSRVTGLSCHPRLQIIICELNISVGMPGPHDFAVHVSTFRQACCRVHRIPHPTLVTIAKRPSWWEQDSAKMRVIWGQRKANYFLGEDWTGRNSLILFRKLGSARRTQFRFLVMLCRREPPDRANARPMTGSAYSTDSSRHHKGGHGVRAPLPTLQYPPPRIDRRRDPAYRRAADQAADLVRGRHQLRHVNPGCDPHAL
jgi:hypothetical protein